MTLRDEGWVGFGEARSDDQGALKRYLDTIRERKWIVILAVVLCTLAAAAYAFTAHKVYTASAEIFVNPAPSDSTNYLGVGLLRFTGDPTQDQTTASELVDNAGVAAQARQNLGWRESPAAVLRQVSVQPVANSMIISITASTGSPARSLQLANAFAQAAIQVRTEQLHQAMVPAIQNMRRQIQEVTGGAPNIAEQPLYQQLSQMQSLLSTSDPDLQIGPAATLPTGPASPNRKLDIAGGVLAGLLIGIAGAFALKALDPRRAREAGLGATGLPVLTRVPVLGRSGRTRHAFDEAFRSLRTTLRFAASDTPVGTVAVTSASEKEGKTTTSFQLAMAALEAGQSVLLVDTDPFRPGLRSLIEPFGGERSGAGLLEYLAGTAGLDDIIERTTVPDLMFVPAGSHQATSFTRLLEGDRGRAFVSHLSGLADLVILDCPPVVPRSDAVLIASEAEAVLMVVDLERSDENDVLDTLRRLRRAGAHLLGIVLNRDTSASAVYDYDVGKGSGLPGTLSSRR